MRRTGMFMLTVVAMLAVQAAGAADIDDARLARQCPAMAAWIQARKTEAAAKRRAYPVDKPSEPALRAELLGMSHADQKVRHAVIANAGKDPASIKAVLAVDAHNLSRIRQIDAGQGFPAPAQVGYDGMQAAWLLVQHADRDPTLQMHVLKELRARPDNGGIGAQDFALFTDRVLVARHKPQRYGTQSDPKGIEAGKLVPWPIEDPANVDKRRAAIGLPPLADYECMLRMVYTMPTNS